MKAPIYSLALAVLLATPLPVAAQTVDAEAIVDALRTDLPGRGKRGLTILDDEDVPPPAIDLRIGFESAADVVSFREKVLPAVQRHMRPG